MEDETDSWDTKNWPTDPAERAAFKDATFMARWGNPAGVRRLTQERPNLQQLPKLNPLSHHFVVGVRDAMAHVSATGELQKLFEKKDPTWYVVQTDSSPGENGRDVRIISRPAEFGVSAIDAFAATMLRVPVLMAGNALQRHTIKSLLSASLERARMVMPSALDMPHTQRPLTGTLRRRQITTHVLIALANWRTK